jgi:hypothetical protein
MVMLAATVMAAAVVADPVPTDVAFRAAHAVTLLATGRPSRTIGVGIPIAYPEQRAAADPHQPDVPVFGERDRKTVQGKSRGVEIPLKSRLDPELVR